MNYEDNFEVYIKREKGCSDLTVAAYRSDIDEFCSFLENRGKSFEKTLSSDVAAYVMGLQDAGKSPSTINRKLSSLRAFFRYMQGLGAISENPAEAIKSEKPAERQLKYLTVEEVERLLAVPDDSVSGKRDRAMLELMYATGMRVSELCAANTYDMDLRIGFISVSSEKKTRMIPIGKPARQALRAYVDKPRKSLLGAKEDTHALFLSYTGERLTRQGVWKILKQCAAKAGLEDKLSPQILRNSFAAHMIQNGADLKSLQELMGHDDILATKIYLSLTKNRIMDVYDRAFPRA